MSVIGLRVGPFEIVEPASVPEPGDWYRAHRTGLTRRQPTEVLVKLLAPDAPDADRAALQGEFDNLRAMEDPRVPEAVALYEGIGALAIAAPDGITLDDVVEARGRGSIAMTPATLLDLALEIAETLQHAHHRNRLHGHLCGGNIRLSTSGKLHIFGFATGPTVDAPLAWIAPERARGEPATPATDQWGLAAVMAALVSGRAPWADIDEGAIKNGDVEPIVEPIERQWPALSRLLRRMLEADPANRYPSMQPVRTELLALARKAGGTSEKRDLGKLMARRVGRTVTPDGDVPAEFTAHTAPPELPPDTFDTPDDTGTAATEAGDAPPDTAADTVHDPHAIPETAEEMEPPPTPRREPAAAAPVPVAERVQGHVDRGTPLPMERIQAVHPDLASEEVPEARREDDLDLPGPAADGPTGFGGFDEPVLLQTLHQPKPESDEDVADAPTERYDPAKLRELEDLDDLPPKPALTADPPVDPTLAADEESSDAGLPPDELARALAVDASRVFGGEGPTAVPVTDVDEPPSEIDEVPQPARPHAPPPDVRPVAPALDEPVQEAVREHPFEPPEPSSIQRFAPLLVLVMVVLMLGFIALAVW